MASEPLIALPAAWPAMSLADATAALTAPGAKFEMETIDDPRRADAGVEECAAVAARADRGCRARMASGCSRSTRTSASRYDANYRAVAALATQLRELGVGKGDRVALAMRNLPEWPVAFFAATAIGAIVVPLNAWWTGAELEYGLADSGAKVLIVDDERHARLRRALRRAARRSST